MGWFSNRQQRKNEAAGQVFEGTHRSPGFEVICHFLETEPAYTVLDLGPSSNENLELISELCDDFIVQDVFRSAQAQQGMRAEAFQFESAKAASLPEDDQKFDVVLIWDLLHYFAKEDRKDFVQRIARCCAPNAMVLLVASAIATIPLVPIQFKTLRRDRLEYVLGEDRAPSPGLTTREVEQLMVGFKPVRIFQLRNGMQEMVFQIPEPLASAKPLTPGQEPAAPAPSSSGSNAKAGEKSEPQADASPEKDTAADDDGDQETPEDKGDGESKSGSSRRRSRRSRRQAKR